MADDPPPAEAPNGPALLPLEFTVLLKDQLPGQEPENYLLRELDENDFGKGYRELLAQLTDPGELSDESRREAAGHPTAPSVDVDASRRDRKACLYGARSMEVCLHAQTRVFPGTRRCARATWREDKPIRYMYR